MKFIKNNLHYFILALTICLGLFIRFNHIEQMARFGWDQARDAWVVRDLLMGQFPLDGPRTGVGQFHLGPVYYYLLAPFFLLTSLDPVGSIYFTIFVSLLTFIIFYIIFQKLFSTKIGLLAALIYALNNYAVAQNRTSWNVSLVPAVSLLIFYVLYKILMGNHNFIIILAALVGFFFQLHFTVVLFFLIAPLSWLVVPNKNKSWKYILWSIPIFVIWFLPTFVSMKTNSGGDIFRYRNFLSDYFVGFHLQFIRHRFNESFLQVQNLISFPQLSFLRFGFPIVFFVWALILKRKSYSNMAWISFCYLLSSVIVFGVYGGPISDYYFLLLFPVGLVMLMFVQKQIFKLKITYLNFLVFVFWMVYFIFNINIIAQSKPDGGLESQKVSALQAIRSDQKIEYNEGSIVSYLYVIWTDQKKK